jgi:hypothetical protein
VASTSYRWVQRFTPLFIDAAPPCRRAQVRAGSLTSPTLTLVFRVPSGLEVDGVVISGRKLVVACRWKSGPGSCQEAR